MSISCCDGATSWWWYSIPIPIASSAWIVSLRNSVAASSAVMAKYPPSSSVTVDLLSRKRKYSSSGPTLNVSKPSDRMRSSARRSTKRGSPSYGSPFGFTTSQIMRATFASPSRVGISRNVVGSGIATMSDSSIALKPVIDEPSKPMPSSRAPFSWDGVIAKLFRWPSMWVNQKRTYSTPSFSVCLSTSFRASGSDVARSLLSIIDMRSRSFSRGPPSSQRRRRRSAGEQRAGQVHPLESPLEPQPVVHASHRGIREVVLRAQEAVAGGLRPCDLRLLQRSGDPPPARAPRNPGHRMLRRVAGVSLQDRVADDRAPAEGHERQLRDRQRAEVPVAPLLERPARHPLARGDVRVGLERHGVRARKMVRGRNDRDAARRLDARRGGREVEEDVLHPAHLREAAPPVVLERVRVVVADDAVEARLAERPGVVGGARIQRRPDAAAPLLARHADREVREVATRRPAELRRRRDADRDAVAVRDQVQVVGLPPLVQHRLARHRRLRVHPVADAEIGVDVRVARDRADGDHDATAGSSCSSPWWAIARP